MPQDPTRECVAEAVTRRRIEGRQNSPNARGSGRDASVRWSLLQRRHALYAALTVLSSTVLR